MINLIRKWICILFHKKESRVITDYSTFDSIIKHGCYKCGRWEDE